MNYDLNIHTNPDAREWSKFFIQTIQEQNLKIQDIDEEFMLGWFANAMMAMHDHLILKGMPLNGDHAQFLLDNESK